MRLRDAHKLSHISHQGESFNSGSQLDEDRAQVDEKAKQIAAAYEELERRFPEIMSNLVAKPMQDIAVQFQPAMPFDKYQAFTPHNLDNSERSVGEMQNSFESQPNPELPGTLSEGTVENLLGDLNTSYASDSHQHVDQRKI